MAIRGPLSHIDLSVSQPARSIPFYAALLEALGFQRVALELPGFEGPAPQRALWRLSTEPRFEIEVRPAEGEAEARAVDRYAPGLHHLAFHAESREDTDRIFHLMRDFGAQVLDPPAEYAYSPGYYAVFFADPDGTKLEVAPIPEENP